MRLVNVKDLSKAGVALELTEFQSLVYKHIDAAKECLKTQWFPKVQDIFLLVSELILSAGCIDSQGFHNLYSLHVNTRVRLFECYSHLLSLISYHDIFKNVKEKVSLYLRTMLLRHRLGMYSNYKQF
jgi:hypothetical protein